DAAGALLRGPSHWGAARYRGRPVDRRRWARTAQGWCAAAEPAGGWRRSARNLGRRRRGVSRRQRPARRGGRRVPGWTEGSQPGVLILATEAAQEGVEAPAAHWSRRRPRLPP